MSYSVSSKRSLPMWSFIGSGIYRNSPNSSNENLRILQLSLSSDNGSSSGQEPQDADYVLPLPCLSDEIETMILASFPISKHWKMCCLNKKYLNLMKNGEIYKIRRMIGLKEPSVFMLASGERNWCVFDGQFKSCRKLPIIPSDYKFECVVKEAFSAGTHLFVSGMEIDGAVIWRYELTTNEWFKGPSMITPRRAFAKASCDTFAYVAGGLETKNCIELDNTKLHLLLNSAEKYNSENQTWQKLPNMNQKRESCSGCYLDNKFYVIGGRDENDNDLTCGEFFDEKTNKWILIPNMLKDIVLSSSRLPPLIAVVNNELYTLDASTNEVKVYMKSSNLWKKLGFVPVRTDNQFGWGVTFKSLGNELLVIYKTVMKIFKCFPHPDLEVLEWKQIVCGSGNPNSYIHNCAVMLT